MPTNLDDDSDVPDDFVDETPTTPITVPDDAKDPQAVPPPPRTVAAGTTPPYADAATERTSERVAIADIERAQFRALDVDGDD